LGYGKKGPRKFLVLLPKDADARGVDLKDDNEKFGGFNCIKLNPKQAVWDTGIFTLNK